MRIRALPELQAQSSALNRIRSGDPDLSDPPDALAQTERRTLGEMGEGTTAN